MVSKINKPVTGAVPLPAARPPGLAKDVKPKSPVKKPQEAVSKPAGQAAKLYQKSTQQNSLDPGPEPDSNARFAPPSYKATKRYRQTAKGPRTLVVTRYRRIW